MTVPADTSYVYGLWPYHESFAVLPEGKAVRLAAEIARVKACGTVGEALALAPLLVETELPDDVDELEEKDPAEPWDWQETDLVQDCDWPPMPTGYALNLLPREVIADLMGHAGSSEVSTMFSGEYLEIPEGQEDRLVEVLRRHGLQARRDDALITSLSLE